MNEYMDMRKVMGCGNRMAGSDMALISIMLLL